jgi:hypothetical protein
MVHAKAKDRGIFKKIRTRMAHPCPCPCVHTHVVLLWRAYRLYVACIVDLCEYRCVCLCVHVLVAKLVCIGVCIVVRVCIKTWWVAYVLIDALTFHTVHRCGLCAEAG